MVCALKNLLEAYATKFAKVDNKKIESEIQITCHHLGKQITEKKTAYIISWNKSDLSPLLFDCMLWVPPLL